MSGRLGSPGLNSNAKIISFTGGIHCDITNSLSNTDTHCSKHIRLKSVVKPCPSMLGMTWFQIQIGWPTEVAGFQAPAPALSRATASWRSINGTTISQHVAVLLASHIRGSLESEETLSLNGSVVPKVTNKQGFSVGITNSGVLITSTSPPS
jgi:hypothetical protein